MRQAYVILGALHRATLTALQLRVSNAAAAIKRAVDAVAKATIAAEDVALVASEAVAKATTRYVGARDVFVAKDVWHLLAAMLRHCVILKNTFLVKPCVTVLFRRSHLRSRGATSGNGPAFPPQQCRHPVRETS